MNSNCFFKFNKLSFSLLFLLLMNTAFSQGNAPAANSQNVVLTLFSIVILLMIFMSIILGNQVIKNATKDSKSKHLKDKKLIPSKKELFGEKKQKELVNGQKKKIHSLKKGFNINIEGKAKKEIKSLQSKYYGIQPKDFIGMQPIPKMLVKKGDKVKAGDKLFYDKGFEGVFITSPVSGIIEEVNRGAKRAIDNILIKSDANFEFKKFKKGLVNQFSEKDIRIQLQESGAWALITERPFGVIPQKDSIPKAIYISTFDTAPLAPEHDFVANNISKSDFQFGIDILSILSNNINLNIPAFSKSRWLEEIENVNFNFFEGVHPSGNVGVQIHHIEPINKGDVVWTVPFQDVVTIGKLFSKGIYEPIRIASLAGPRVENPIYLKLLQGACIKEAVIDNLKDKHVRVISGNVLTGKSIGLDGFLGFSHTSISVIEEGDQQEFMGWLFPSYPRPSISPTIPWSKIPYMSFDVNTNMHGEKRAFVVTGQYESVLPMDVYVQLLLKAILSKEFEEMEGLGIYELLEEDIALCEFVCTSKQPVQHILREGLDYIRAQS